MCVMNRSGLGGVEIEETIVAHIPLGIYNLKMAPSDLLSLPNGYVDDFVPIRVEGPQMDVILTVMPEGEDQRFRFSFFRREDIEPAFTLILLSRDLAPYALAEQAA